MENGNIKTWVLEPDVCRCCLAANGTMDMTASYITDTGIKEIFSDVLQECFGIKLYRLSDWGCSGMICADCVGELRNACHFRKKVLEAENKFQDHWKDASNLSEKNEDILINTFTDSSDFTGKRDDIKDQLQVQTKSRNIDKNVLVQKKLNREIKGHERKIKKKKRSQIWIEYDNDSDTPLVNLSSKDDVSTPDNEEAIVNKGDQSEVFDESNLDEIKFCFEEQSPKQDVKQVSERKRVILTCGIVLKDTTACPFRHHKSWFQCFFCSEDFMEINLLRNHILQTHSNIEEELRNIKRYPRSLQIDISELKCRHCDLTLTDVDAMTRHFEFSHQKVIYKECIADYKVDVSPYTCHLCKREFHVFRTLTTHLNEHYANCICDVCGKSFLNSKRFKVHKRTHENGTYPCNECGKVLKTKTSKANHMESAHSKRVVKCQICFKPMKHYNDRIKHMSEVHNITHKFKCSICSREYNIKHYLATHMRQTHGHKNKKCLECGMAFITNHGLKKHMLRHSGEKPYSCTICSKSYVRSSTLREHMRVHSGDKKI